MEHAVEVVLVGRLNSVIDCFRVAFGAEASCVSPIEEPIIASFVHCLRMRLALERGQVPHRLLACSISLSLLFLNNLEERFSLVRKILLTSWNVDL